MFQGYDPERIGIQPEWLFLYIDMHKKNSPDAKYKIGDKVIYKIRSVSIGTKHEILAINVCDRDVVEYALSNINHLVWEEELFDVIH